MTALALRMADDRGAGRWAFSATIVTICHAAIVAFCLHLAAQHAMPGTTASPVLIDLAPNVSAAPPSQLEEVAPGPEMQQAEASQPEPVAPPPQEAPPELLEPTAMQEHAEIAAPLESMPASVPTPPVETEVEPQPIQTRPKPKPVPRERRKDTQSKPAPRTSAAPKAERQADSVSGAVAGSAFALASYNQIVAAHLQRFKQYPAAARAAGQQGVARVAFTLGRNGQVLGSSLAGSSGSPALDGETVAMVRRAQPFPPMPSDIRQASMSFVVPVRFAAR